MRENCVPVGLAVNPQLACVTPMMCAADETEAIARGLEGANFFGYSLAHFYVFGDHVPGKTNVWQEFQEWRGTRWATPPKPPSPPPRRRSGQGGGRRRDRAARCAVGTPAQLREFLRRYEDAGVDQLIFVMQAGRTATSTSWSRSSCSAARSSPSSSSATRPRAAAKAEHWCRIIEAAMARKVDTAPRMPDDYVMRALPKQMVDAMHNAEAENWLEDLADAVRRRRSGRDILKGNPQQLTRAERFRHV